LLLLLLDSVLIVFSILQVAKGFQWGLEGMCEGGIRRITVPPSVGEILSLSLG